MTDRSGTTGHTVAYTARLAWGLALLTAPAALLAAFRADDDERARITMRILGARHVIQSLICGRRPDPTTAGIAAAVDTAHALTAVGFAALDSHRRRIALTDAAVAAAWATADAHIIHQA